MGQHAGCGHQLRCNNCPGTKVHSFTKSRDGAFHGVTDPVAEYELTALQAGAFDALELEKEAVFVRTQQEKLLELEQQELQRRLEAEARAKKEADAKREAEIKAAAEAKALVAIAAEAKAAAVMEEERLNEEQRRERLRQELEEKLEQTRKKMAAAYPEESGKKQNRYGNSATMIEFREGVDVPLLALIMPTSGAKAGRDVLAVARRTPYYKERFFNIMDVVKGFAPGGQMDLFRRQLSLAKEDAKRLGTRPRVISGGGDGTGSFVLSVIFKALAADGSREDEDLSDTGNGFIWTESELSESFPALAQMPLGSANDFAHILGWGYKYPGDPSAYWCARPKKIDALNAWIKAVCSPDSEIVNFDIFGVMPGPGCSACNFKVAELTGKKGWNCRRKVDGKQQLVLKEAGLPAPFFACLYMTFGFMAQVVARFQLNRHSTPRVNKLEYVRQGAAIILSRTPPQLRYNLTGIEADADGQPYFPPRRAKGNKAAKYIDVGFYNINWQGGYAHAADRAPCMTRMCSSKRRPASFNDGEMDVLRKRLTTELKNPGTRYQTDKKKSLTVHCKGEHGKGIFFQYDGEARFAFSPSGQDFEINIRRILNIPVVVGPNVNTRLTGNLNNGKVAEFHWSGSTQEAKEEVRSRMLQFVNGEIRKELIATTSEIMGAALIVPPEDAPEQ